MPQPITELARQQALHRRAETLQLLLFWWEMSAGPLMDKIHWPSQDLTARLDRQIASRDAMAPAKRAA